MHTDELYRLLHLRQYQREDIVALLALQESEEIELLYRRADQVRREYVGDEIHLRGIIEIHNHCDRNCLYCGLRKWNAGAERYRMTLEEILASADRVVAAEVPTVILQSGEDDDTLPEFIADAVSRIKAKHDVAITLSLGEKDESVYRLWKEAGADRYLLKHETYNRELFKKLKPDSDYDSRMVCLQTLKRLGYQVGTGNMIGLPGQTLGDIADDILFCRELEADMCAFGPFIPSPETPLHDAAAGSPQLSLQTIAVARLVLKDAHLPANTALGTVDKGSREKAFACGGNIMMPNFTPLEHRHRYQIYPNKGRENFDPYANKEIIVQLAASLGRPIARSKGHSLK